MTTADRPGIGHLEAVALLVGGVIIGSAIVLLEEHFSSGVQIDWTVILSAAAIVLSTYTVWTTNLRPFSLRILKEEPTFALYKITPEMSGTKSGKTWWIPSFDMGLSFHNLGSQSGQVLTVRLRDSTGKREPFYAKWVVDYTKFNECYPDRFKWNEEAVIRSWYPALIRGMADTHLHIVLESSNRWDGPFDGQIQLELEVLVTPKKWLSIGKYKLDVDKDMFEHKDRFTLADESKDSLRQILSQETVSNQR